MLGTGIEQLSRPSSAHSELTDNEVLNSLGCFEGLLGGYSAQVLTLLSLRLLLLCSTCILILALCSHNVPELILDL